MGNWKEQMAIEYSHKPEDIGRETARRYNIPWSTCFDFKQLLKRGDYDPISKGPKILLFDIETAPVLSHVWGLWGANVGINQIMEDWYMLSWAAKWLGEDEVYSDNLFDYSNFDEAPEDDYNIIVTLYKLLDEADIVIGHNLKRFDDKKFKARCLKHGLPPLSSYRKVDTLEIAKREFALTSNKLDYLATYLGFDNKVSHEGHTLWVKCMSGVEEAWDTMMDYNEYDVVLLEKVYLVLRQWASNHPNVAVYYKDLKRRCSVCGSTDVHETGKTVKTNLGEYKEYSCNCCGKIGRDGTNLLPKEKRESLTRNVL